MLIIPTIPFRRRGKQVKTATELTLVSATYDQVTSKITLEFNQAIDIAGLVGSAIVVSDGDFESHIYAATGTATLTDPQTVEIGLVSTGTYFTPGVKMTASGSNGIVGAVGAMEWVGVTDLALPFP